MVELLKSLDQESFPSLASSSLSRDLQRELIKDLERRALSKKKPAQWRALLFSTSGRAHQRPARISDGWISGKCENKFTFLRGHFNFPDIFHFAVIGVAPVGLAEL